MKIKEVLDVHFGKLYSLEQIEPNIMRLYAPFFHEDGDMLSIYLEDMGDSFIVRDFGNTLMRVSYSFSIDTDNKQRILDKIVKSNYGRLEDGELLMQSSVSDLSKIILQFSQLIAKVSNIDILSRETVRSLFNEYLKEFIFDTFEDYEVSEKYVPTTDDQLIVDFKINSKRPFYLFGVNDDVKASKVVISCLNFQKLNIPFRSIVIHENPDELTRFNRNQLMRAADKQFPSLEDFKHDGRLYLEREIA